MQWQQFDWLIEAALREDGARRDVTTDALVSADLRCKARMLAKGHGVICGLPLAARVCEVLDKELKLEPACEDGSPIEKGTEVARIAGPAAGLLKVERTLLNFVQRLSGIATLTRRFCDAVDGTGAEVFDTRKTTPGWRALEKYAVRCGGGRNHRMGLSDQVLIKDNHLALWLAQPGGDIAGAVSAARKAAGADMVVEVEVERLDDLEEALDAGADVVLLDNMTPEQVRTAAAVVRRKFPRGQRPLLEASGSINLENIRAYAEAGADRISVGALTHSAPALDVSLQME